MTTTRERNEFNALVLAERQRQVAKGYTAEHDDKHGVDTLLMYAQEYARIEEPIKSAALIEAAREAFLRQASKTTAASVESAAEAYYLASEREMGYVEGDCTPWAEAGEDTRKQFRWAAGIVLEAGTEWEYGAWLIMEDGEERQTRSDIGEEYIEHYRGHGMVIRRRRRAGEWEDFK